MKSVQGTLFYARRASVSGFTFLNYPLDNAFKQHTMTFNDGTQIPFTLAFFNNKNKYSRDESDLDGGIDRISNYVSPERELQALERMNNFNKIKRHTRAEHKEVLCGMSKDGNMNYIILDTFDPQNETLFYNELVECVQDFDENDKPITIILSYNSGGYISLQELVKFLLMPPYDIRTIEAARNTEFVREYMLRYSYYRSLAPISKKCEMFTNVTAPEFLKYEERDDFGSGGIHVRTKKMIQTSLDVSEYEPYTLKKHVRKPTDIIVATDGYCFSACSFFVNNIIRSGSAIVAGFGTTTPGDELFAAGQCPSTQIYPMLNNKTISDLSGECGLYYATPVMETFNISKDFKETIPGDYDVLRVDVHCGYNTSHYPNTNNLLAATLKVHQRFMTECNPNNHHLIFVTENCTCDDPHALYCGYACGKDSVWDKTVCKISACVPGYVVDYESNKCVRNDCDCRPHIYNSSDDDEEHSLDSASKCILSLMSIILVVIISLIY